jgi:hypothetical protein
VMILTAFLSLNWCVKAKKMLILLALRGIILL